MIKMKMHTISVIFTSEDLWRERKIRIDTFDVMSRNDFPMHQPRPTSPRGSHIQICHYVHYALRKTLLLSLLSYLRLECF